jgi:hypothetical protein
MRRSVLPRRLLSHNFTRNAERSWFFKIPPLCVFKHEASNARIQPPGSICGTAKSCMKEQLIPVGWNELFGGVITGTPRPYILRSPTFETLEYLL